MSSVESMMMECILDGQESGIELAVEALSSMKNEVAVESQNWDSAIAVLNIFLAKAKEDRIAKATQP